MSKEINLLDTANEPTYAALSAATSAMIADVKQKHAAAVQRHGGQDKYKAKLKEVTEQIIAECIRGRFAGDGRDYQEEDKVIASLRRNVQ